MSNLEARLKALMDREGDVVAAYLFGSEARGTSSPLSDVDVAVLLDPIADPGRRHAELVAAVASEVGSDRADVLVLNDAPVAVGYRVVRDGRLLSSRDEKARIRHWVKTIDRYLDMEPFRRTIEEGQRHRIEEGRFGRP